MALDNGGSKAPIFGCRGGEGPVQHNCKTWDVWARHGVEGGFSHLINPVYLFDNKACTWKRGHGCH